MKELKVKKEFLGKMVGATNFAKLLGEMSQKELSEVYKLFLEGNNLKDLDMFETDINPNHLTYFKVENFKRFNSFEMDNIGQFNLIVGDNNVGKTSVLEALLVEKTGWQASSYWNSILQEKNYELSEFNNLYTIFLNDENSNGAIKFYLNKEDSPITIERGPGLTVVFRTGTKDDITLSLNSTNPHYIKPFVSSFQRNNRELFTVFSQISDITKDFDELIENLKIFLNNLKDIRIGSQTGMSREVFKVRLKDKPKTQLLNIFGDGTLFAFEIMVKIFANKGNRLMIDEMDSGIHYTRMKEYIQRLLEMAMNLDVQLFMTTHSKECLVYYKEALEELGTEYQEQARVIELNELKNKSVKSITHLYPDFARSIELDNEIRGGY